MGDLIDNKNKNLVSLFHNKQGDITIPKPFEKEIFLFDTHIAGTSHIEGIEELKTHMNPDEKLDFFREPDNQYDPKAIVIKNSNGVKLGYVPQADNIIFSRLMDAGKLLFGRIEDIETRGKWLKIYIQVYLQE